MKQSRMIGLRIIPISCIFLAVIEMVVGDPVDFRFTTAMLLMAAGLEAVRFELVRIHTLLRDDKESNKYPDHIPKVQ